VATLPPAPFRVALVGAGRVGTAVAHLLRGAGHRIVSISSRSPASAQAAAARLEAPIVEAGEVRDADVILLGVPDSALTTAAAALPRTGSVLVHFAGAAGTKPLQNASAGRALCALHPVQACPDVETAIRRLPGSAWGVTCSPGVEAWVRRLIEEDLKGTPFGVAEEDRVVWHAAAVTTSNGISALLAVAESLLASVGIARPELVLGPIAAGTVLNVLERGGGGLALTGPVVRKETDVIGRHVAEIARRAPDLLPAYLQSLHMIVSSALVAGRIDHADELLLRQALDSR
jgi:predicted short-subunit dehydrogenase-like oxidoreductase (DUF2520 family)